jgi:hypothetical protein
MQQTDENNVEENINRIHSKKTIVSEFNSELDNSVEVIDYKSNRKICRSQSETTIESKRSHNTAENIFNLNVISKDKLFNSPIMKFNKRVCDSSDSEDNTNKKYYSSHHHDSLCTSSSDDHDESENNSLKGKKMNKKYNFKKSKSISENKRSSGNFQVVNEENYEDEIDFNSKPRITLHNLKNKLNLECHDSIEEAYLDKKIKFRSQSTKCFGIMDPVIEEKEELDTYKQKFAPFKKLKFVHDHDEDNKIKVKSNSFIVRNFEYDAIEEDYREDDIDNADRKKKNKKPKFPDFIDKSDIMTEELYVNKAKNVITEEIKEELEDNINEHNEELLYRKNRSKCNIFLHY